MEVSGLITRMDAVLWTLIDRKFLGGNGRRDEYGARLGFWGLRERLSIDAFVGKKVEESKLKALRI